MNTFEREEGREIVKKWGEGKRERGRERHT
jgi:hypothetical protein